MNLKSIYNLFYLLETLLFWGYGALDKVAASHASGVPSAQCISFPHPHPAPGSDHSVCLSQSDTLQTLEEVSKETHPMACTSRFKFHSQGRICFDSIITVSLLSTASGESRVVWYEVFAPLRCHCELTKQRYNLAFGGLFRYLSSSKALQI